MEDDHQDTKSPQEKKAFSYAKDRRNGYGENAKASRNAIPRRKAVESRGNRRNVAQTLSAIDRLNVTAAETVESSARHGLERVGGWTKMPDVSLADHLEQRKRTSHTGKRGDKNANSSEMDTLPDPKSRS